MGTPKNVVDTPGWKENLISDTVPEFDLSPSSAAPDGYAADSGEDGIVLHGKLTGVKLHRNASGQCKVILETGEGTALHARTVIIDNAEQIDHWVAVDQRDAA